MCIQEEAAKVNPARDHGRESPAPHHQEYWEPDNDRVRWIPLQNRSWSVGRGIKNQRREHRLARSQVMRIATIRRRQSVVSAVAVEAEVVGGFVASFDRQNSG